MKSYRVPELVEGYQAKASLSAASSLREEAAEEFGILSPFDRLRDPVE